MLLRGISAQLNELLLVGGGECHKSYMLKSMCKAVILSAVCVVLAQLLLISSERVIINMDYKCMLSYCTAFSPIQCAYNFLSVCFY